jgi:glycosyltransferase involved in cell wall biosynthesis
MNPSVSVIVPAFNAEATLAETLASIRNQLYQPIEVIVVDDGSTDGTAKLAQSFSFVRVLTQQNAGVAKAFNAGVAESQGDYIAFLDADDLWTPECLALHVAAFVADRSALAAVGHFEEFVCPSLSPADAARFAPRPKQVAWLGGATMISRLVFGEHGVFNPDLRLGVWIEWFGRARTNGLSIITHEGLVLQRRLRPGTLSSNKDAMKQDLLKIARAALEKRRANNNGIE